MNKEVRIKWTYNNTILELQFLSIPRKGWWKENMQPAVDFMKAHIPATSREYNSDTQRWNIGAEFWLPMKTFFELMHFTITEVKDIDIPNVHVPKEYAENFHYSEPVKKEEAPETIAIELSKYLGVEITTQDVKELKKLYRAKALELHPDRGGDAAAMSELNRLWTLFTATERIQ